MGATDRSALSALDRPDSGDADRRRGRRPVQVGVSSVTYVAGSMFALDIIVLALIGTRVAVRRVEGAQPGDGASLRLPDHAGPAEARVIGQMGLGHLQSYTPAGRGPVGTAVGGVARSAEQSAAGRESTELGPPGERHPVPTGPIPRSGETVQPSNPFDHNRGATMASIGTSLDPYVEDFFTDCPGDLREQALSLFHEVMEELCNGGDPSLTLLTDELLDLHDRAERLCDVDHRMRLLKLQVERIIPRFLDHGPQLAARHATHPGRLAGLRNSIDDLYRAFAGDGERIEEALEPHVVDVFCRMVVVVNEHLDEFEDRA